MRILTSLLFFLSLSVQAQTYFARIDNGVVAEVIIAGPEAIDGRSGTWVQTWPDANGAPEKRYNYAGRGYLYDGTAFYAVKPFPSWTLGADYKWTPPTPRPDDGKLYRWNEQTLSWVEI